VAAIHQQECTILELIYTAEYPETVASIPGKANPILDKIYTQMDH
jgi:hypothetical protein